MAQLVSLSESAIEFSWGNRVDAVINRQVHAFAHMIRQLNIPGVIDIIPAYSSVTLIFNLPVFISTHGLLPMDFMQGHQHYFFQLLKELPAHDEKVITIPVCYDPLLGNDLEKLAAANNISVDEIIQLHCSSVYLVYMLGFLPGFTYMGEVDKRIAFARKEKPVPVKAGAVAIAGKQTGIYPVDTPGGWNILGYTPLKIFESGRQPACLLEPGASVQFSPVDSHTFNHLQMQMKL